MFFALFCQVFKVSLHGKTFDVICSGFLSVLPCYDIVFAMFTFGGFSSDSLKNVVREK